MRQTLCFGFALSLSLAPRLAAAFCGFYVAEGNAKLYNNATQVVLLRQGTRTALSMQNNYEGPPEKFAMVVPVPVVLQKESVKTLDRALLDKLDQLDAPRLVEYWEQDPCYEPPPYDDELLRLGVRYEMATAPAVEAEAKALVRVEATFAVGEYDVVILSAEDAGALEKWLKQEKYAIPEGAEPYLRPYVEQGSKFFVAKVDPQRVKFEGNKTQLSPLRFHYDAETFSLPIRLGLINAKDTQDLIVHVLAKARYEAANHPNVTIPTNLDVTESVRGDFAPFYAALFDATLAKHPRSIVTEYAWSASSCDPCPGPALEDNDLKVLGADTLGSPVQVWEWTLTRLHARYAKADLGADIVFKEAAPIVGGREILMGGKTLEKGAQPSSVNNFQGRYAVRHPWTGPIACKNPRRGVWGGDPKYEGPKPARDLAFAPRGAIQLTSLLRTDVEELGIRASGEPVAHGSPALPQKRVTLFGVPAWIWMIAPIAIVLTLVLVRMRRRPS